MLLMARGASCSRQPDVLSSREVSFVLLSASTMSCSLQCLGSLAGPRPPRETPRPERTAASHVKRLRGQDGCFAPLTIQATGHLRYAR